MKIDWDSYSKKYENKVEEPMNANYKQRVGFFSLKNDGDEAIVRIMHDTPKDFELIAVHRVQLEDGKIRQISCLRNPSDPIDMCPLCADNTKVDLRIYIKLLEYVKQENGSVVPVAKVWERSSSYARKLAGLMAEYGPLSDCIFKIKRHGAPGSKKTDYEILPMSEKVYPSSVYVKNTSLLEGYSALGTIVLEKTYDEMLKGDFSYKSSSTNNKSVEPTYVDKSEPTYASKTEPTYAPRTSQATTDSLPWKDVPVEPTYESRTMNQPSDVQPSAEPQRQPNYYGANSDTMQRPRRTYFEG